MAISYYDWTSSSTSTSTGTSWTYDNSTSTSSWSNNSVFGSTGCYYIVPMRIRRVYVESPDHWSEEDNIAYMHLVNEDTNTGWIVESIINGDVLITDPSVEKRTLKDFLPLLRQSASRADREKIDAFFETHNVE